MKNAFDRLDLNKDGKLSKDKIINIFSCNFENDEFRHYNINDDILIKKDKINPSNINTPYKLIFEDKEYIDFNQFKI